MSRPRNILALRGSRRHRRGFTLVEVLATLVLIGIVLPFAVRGTSVALNTASNAKHVAEAAGLAEAKLAEIVSQGDWATGTTQGDFGQEWPEYKWRVQTTTSDTTANVTEIMLSVVWTERGKERAFNVSTLAYLSADAGAGVLP
jgi:prepilin-type N-terminal cleavage/methylation domain-containing protein